MQLPEHAAYTVASREAYEESIAASQKIIALEHRGWRLVRMSGFRI
jgi:hypothetical protein